MERIISLILPAYNVAEYIEACVESCENQDLGHDQYELVIVNDGSTDETPEKLRSLSIKYHNIKVVNQENQGLSMARNNGFAASSGKYIWFVDADDTLTVNCLSSLLAVMENHRLDALTVGPSIPFRNVFPSDFDETRDVSEVTTGVGMLIKSTRFVVGAWCYVFKRSFWQEHHFRFYPKITYEDTQLMGYVVSKVSRIASLTSFSCYNYIQREGSLMHSAETKHKLMSCAVIVNTHLQYARETSCAELKKMFEGSASANFIAGVRKIIALGGGRTCIESLWVRLKNAPVVCLDPPFCGRFTSTLS